MNRLVKGSSCLVVGTLVGLVLSACSGSSGGGGGGTGGGQKPDLTAVTEVNRSFTVVQNAGHQASSSKSNQSTPYPSALTNPRSEKERTDSLRNKISDPNMFCQTSFQNQPSNGSGSQNSSSLLVISGDRCPIVASFAMSSATTSNSIGQRIDMSFQVRDPELAKEVGATKADLHGGINAKMKSDRQSAEIRGLLEGLVQSTVYGQVLVKMTLAGEISGGERYQMGAITTTVEFKFQDATKNVTLVGVETHDGTKAEASSESFTANGASISKAEFLEVMGMVSGNSNSNQSKEPKVLGLVRR